MFGTVSIASRRQSSRPIEASEKRPSAGAVSFARATLNFAARSGPNHGLARAPFTGLRVVATSSIGLVVSSAASKRAPVPAIDAHPSSANTDAVDASTRNTSRRDTASLGFIISIADATLERPQSSLRLALGWSLIRAIAGPSCDRGVDHLCFQRWNFVSKITGVTVLAPKRYPARNCSSVFQRHLRDSARDTRNDIALRRRLS